MEVGAAATILSLSGFESDSVNRASSSWRSWILLFACCKANGSYGGGCPFAVPNEQFSSLPDLTHLLQRRFRSQESCVFFFLNSPQLNWRSLLRFCRSLVPEFMLVVAHRVLFPSALGIGTRWHISTLPGVLAFWGMPLPDCCKNSLFLFCFFFVSFWFYFKLEKKATWHKQKAQCGIHSLM